MNTVFIIRRDVDVNGKTLEGNHRELFGYWAGKNGGGWGWPQVAAMYETRKHAEQAMKRNTKSGEWSFRRGYAYIAEVERSALGK